MEYSWFHKGMVTGDAILSPYTMNEISDFFRKLLIADQNNDGVVGRYINQLEVSDLGGLSASVLTGAALVKGKLYERVSPVVGVTVAGNSKYWLVRLRYDAPAQTVKMIGFIGPYDTYPNAIASLVHNSTYWDIPLGIIKTNAAGNDIENIYDCRKWAIRGSFAQEFIPATGGRNVTHATDIISDYSGVICLDGDDCYVYGQWRIPDFAFYSDFYTYLVVIPYAGGNMYVAQETEYGSCGEDHDSHTVSVALTPETVEAFHNSCILHTPLANASGGDFVLLQARRDATNVLDTIGHSVGIVGWFAEYRSRF